MSAPAVLRSYGPALCPSFAEVCSFLERYGAALDLPEMTFLQMERYLRDTAAGERSLPELGESEAATAASGGVRHHPPTMEGDLCGPGAGWEEYPTPVAPVVRRSGRFSVKGRSFQEYLERK